MPEPMVHIARDEVELGAFPLAEARELLDAGFFQPADDAWAHGMAGWEPLRETITKLTAAGEDWRDKLVVGAEALSRVVGRRVGRLVGNVKAQAAQGRDAVAIGRQLALEHYLPQLQQRLAEHLRHKPVALAQAAVRDATLTRKLFGAFYECLPKPVCRFVAEDAFISFCMEHRERLLGTAGVSPDAPEATTSDDAPRA